MSGAEPSDPSSAGAADADEGGYCIEVCVYPDGHFTVSKESLPEEAAEDGAGGAAGGDPSASGADDGSGGGEDEQSADNISDALKMVLAIYKNESSGAEDDQFNAGFGGASMSKPAQGM
jgi:hypothetical protein